MKKITVLSGFAFCLLLLGYTTKKQKRKLLTQREL